MKGYKASRSRKMNGGDMGDGTPVASKEIN